MFDNIMLLIGAFFTSLLAMLVIAMNTSNAIGPYFCAGVLLLFSVLAVRVTVKYWRVS